MLALDSSTRGGSVALARDGVLVDARAGDPDRRHAVRLPGELLDLLTSHGATLRDVDLLAVASGPGGFTGLRVGLATMQGLALGLDRRVFVASTLDLLAAAGARCRDDLPIGAWMHGQRGEVFTALYTPPRAGRPLPHVLPPTVASPESAAAAWAAALPEGAVTVVGDAWPSLSAPLAERFGERLRPCEPPLLAAVLALEAAQRPDEAVGPAAVRPTYVRRPDAVIARELAGQAVPGHE